MTTITIDNPEIEKKYSSREIQMKFISFLESELGESGIDMYQISVDDLSKKSQERLKNIDTMNFVDY